MVVFSLFAEKCGNCGGTIKNKTALFWRRDQAEIVDAMKNLSAHRLKELPMIAEKKDSVALEMSYCPRCKSVGKYKLVRNDDWNSETLIDETNIQGPEVRGLAHLVRSHADRRDKD